ncbi:MAG: TetR family transcriptional regulator [Deltaproteobacteria bacterium]
MPDPQIKPTASDTRERILDAAEELFAREGLSRPSVRQITTNAGVNVAAVNYHFGSREGLVDAVFARHAESVNGERLRRLEQILAEAGTDRPSLPAILEAYLEVPLLHLDTSPGGSPPRLTQLFGHLLAEPPEFVQPLMHRHFGPMAERFLEAFALALPELPQAELTFRFRLVIAALAATVAQNHGIQSMLTTETEPMDYGQKVKRLVAFLAAGLRAPVEIVN